MSARAGFGGAPTLGAAAAALRFRAAPPPPPSSPPPRREPLKRRAPQGTAQPSREDKRDEKRARLLLREEGPTPTPTPTPTPPRMREATLAGVAEMLRGGRCRNVIVMTGAGISVSAGIPDFRSPGTGLYDNLQRYNLPTPESVFDLGYFRYNPHPFFNLARELYPGNYAPTPAHHFIKLLHDRGVLLRNYTQNIDGLERLAGVPGDKLVEAHGTFASARCIDCGLDHDPDDIEGLIVSGRTPPLCDRCNGYVKPGIVFFGESLPDRFHRMIREDFGRCDLLIVMGTSLCVHPFAGLVDFVADGVPRLLVNLNRVGVAKPPLSLRRFVQLYGHHVGLALSEPVQMAAARRRAQASASLRAAAAAATAAGSDSDDDSVAGSGGGGGGGGGGGSDSEGSDCAPGQVVGEGKLSYEAQASILEQDVRALSSNSFSALASVASSDDDDDDDDGAGDGSNDNSNSKEGGAAETPPASSVASSEAGGNVRWRLEQAVSMARAVNAKRCSQGFRFGWPGNRRDVFWQGTCDEGVAELATLLGWRSDFDRLRARAFVPRRRPGGEEAAGSAPTEVSDDESDGMEPPRPSTPARAPRRSLALPQPPPLPPPPPPAPLTVLPGLGGAACSMKTLPDGAGGAGLSIGLDAQASATPAQAPAPAPVALPPLSSPQPQPPPPSVPPGRMFSPVLSPLCSPMSPTRSRGRARATSFGSSTDVPPAHDPDSFFRFRLL